MKEDNFLAMVSCAMPLTKKSIGGFAFVDNIDICVSSQPMAAMMATQMQNSVTYWEGHLHTMGGALVPDSSSKSGWRGSGGTRCQIKQLLISR